MSGVSLNHCASHWLHTEGLQKVGDNVSVYTDLEERHKKTHSQLLEETIL